MSRKSVWSGFTDVELSMIASHLAGGGALCCLQNRSVRATITDNRSRRARLAHEAYERFGCDPARAEHYLYSFLCTI